MTDNKARPLFHWFQGEAVVELTRRLIAANPDTARLEVYQDGDEMTLLVVADDAARESFMFNAGEDCDKPINSSHLCPPICP